MTSHLQSLIDRGVSAFASGNLNDALRCFQGAHNTISSTAGVHLPPEREELYEERLDVAPMSAPVEPVTDSLDYRCAFTVTSSRDHGIRERNIALCLAVLKYNTAITLQLQGGDGNQRKAFRLYEESLRFLKELTCMEGFITCVARLTIACLHNMTIILFTNEVFEQASAFITLSQQLLALWSTSTQTPLWEHETEEFFSFLPLCEEMINSAPAA